MPGYKSKTHSKKNLKSSNKAKNGGRRRKQTMKKVRRGRKVMRGGDPMPKLTLDEIFDLLKINPDELVEFKKVISDDWERTRGFPDAPKIDYDNTFDTNPSLKKLAINKRDPPPYKYSLKRIVDSIPRSLTTIRQIFMDYIKEAPYVNEDIFMIIAKLEQNNETTLRDTLLEKVQREANLPEHCFETTPEPSNYNSFPKPIFSKEKLQQLLHDTPGLNKTFTKVIKVELGNESRKWNNPDLRTLAKAIAYMD